MKRIYGILLLLLLSCLCAHADVTKAQALSIVSQYTGIASTEFDCTEATIDQVNSQMSSYSFILDVPGVSHEVWCVAKHSGAICGYLVDGSSTRYPMTSAWVWGLFPQFDKSTMVEYPQNSDLWWYRSPQGILCSERLLQISHLDDDPSQPIIGYDAIDLPLPQLDGISVVSKAKVQKLALATAQHMPSWAGPDYADYTNACITRCDEPIYEKDDLGVEWIKYTVWAMSSVLPDVNLSWIRDETKVNDYVEVKFTFDACSGQLLTGEAYPAYSSRRSSKSSVSKPSWKYIGLIDINGKDANLAVAPIISNGKCYLHLKYAQHLMGKAGSQLKNVTFGSARYVAVADIVAHSSIRANYDAKCNKLEISNVKNMYKTKEAK